VHRRRAERGSPHLQVEEIESDKLAAGASIDTSQWLRGLILA
jgi:hypothetical protein